MANTKTQKPSIQGKVGCYNIGFNGKKYILLKGKKSGSTRSFKNKENAQTYAGNLLLIQEKETQIKNLELTILVPITWRISARSVSQPEEKEATAQQKLRCNGRTTNTLGQNMQKADG